VLVAAGDLVAATSGSLTQLISGQAIAGLGAAAIFPSSLAVLVAATPQPKARAQALSYWAVSLAFGAMIAPLISGFVAEHTAWGWSFVLPGVLGLVTAAVSAVFVVDSRQPAGRGLDRPGQLTIAVSLLALLYAVIQGSADGYGSSHVLLGFVVAVAAFAGFLVAERRARTPMLRLELFRAPAFAAATAIGLLALFGFIGTAYALSIKLETILHVSPFQSALPFALIQAIPVLATPFLPKLLQRVPPRVMLVAGLLALAAGQVWMALLPGDTTAPMAMAGPILLLGIGFITMFSALTAVAVGTVDISYRGHGQRGHQPGPGDRAEPRPGHRRGDRARRRRRKPGPAAGFGRGAARGGGRGDRCRRPGWPARGRQRRPGPALPAGRPVGPDRAGTGLRPGDLPLCGGEPARCADRARRAARNGTGRAGDRRRTRVDGSDRLNASQLPAAPTRLRGDI
jgi:hypothetical protein